MAGRSGINGGQGAPDPLEGLCEPDLQDALASWLSALSSERRASPHTLRAYAGDIRQFITYLNGHYGEPVALRHISDAALRDFRGWLSRKSMQGNGAATRARAMSSLRTFYKWLDRNGILHNPSLSLMATPKTPHKVPRPMETEQVFNLIDAAGGGEGEWAALRDRALFGLLYGCGLRIGEGLGLRLRDLDGRPDVLRITGKGQKQREVPVLPAVYAHLDAYRAACPYPETPERPVFLGIQGKKLNAGMVQKHMRELRVTYGLGEGATPHAFRHSYATHLLGEGLNLREVQELLGHASLSTTQRYTEVDYKQLLAIFKKAHPRENIQTKP